MVSITGSINWFTGHLSGLFSETSAEDDIHRIRQRELGDVQATHDFTAIHIQNCFNPNKPSFAGSETLLKLLQEFFDSYDTPASKINSEVRVPILHNKAFEVFYQLQKAGYTPIAEGQENTDFSAAGIVTHAVGVAMRNMEKFAGMNGGDYNSAEMNALGQKMLDYRTQFLRQHAIENPAPGSHKT